MTGKLAETDGNRTRQTEILGLTGLKTRDPPGIQTPPPPTIAAYPLEVTVIPGKLQRLTSYAHGGGCACKIPAGELEDAIRDLIGPADPDVLVGLDDGDDAAAVRVADGLAVLSTADCFTPVVDSPYDWGRIAAANALSDIYAMGGRPVVAINLVGWPRGVLPMEMMTEVLRGGLDVGARPAVR